MYVGKTRDVYNLGYNLLQIVGTDRCSAFDKHVCDIPNKGHCLTEQTVWWFEKTRAICPNHYLWNRGTSMIVQACQPIKLEIIVRGYITGSLWRRYVDGKTDLPEGLKENDPLPDLYIELTTKDVVDVPITVEEAIKQELINEDTWRWIKAKATALFEYGQWVSQTVGLTLVDTKYEFGYNEAGHLILIDEIHTADSSRFWLNGENWSKEVLRRWIKTSNVTKPPDEIIEKMKEIYLDITERFTGSKKIVDISHEEAVKFYFNERKNNMAVMIVEEKDAMMEVSSILKELNVVHKAYLIQSHLQTKELFELLEEYNGCENIVYITISRYNTLPKLVAGRTGHPVVFNPYFKDATDMILNIGVMMRLPHDTPIMTVISRRNTAESVRRILIH